jgi:hypothetical protein
MSLAAPITPVPAAASVLVRDALAGPERRAVVVAAGPAATYLDVDGSLVAVVGTSAVRLPCAVVLAGDAPPLAGARDVTVGGGAVVDRGRRVVEVRRWFDPRVRVRSVDPSAVATVERALRARPCPDALLPADAADRLAAELAAGDAHGAVAALVGRGTGLTPAGDDLLAGALATLRALGSPAADTLGAAIRLWAPRRTARLSAALLVAADAGAVIPPAEAVLRALAEPVTRGDGRSLPPAGHDRLLRATARLLDVGHTSGWHLAAGLAVGGSLAAADRADRAARDGQVDGADRRAGNDRDGEDHRGGGDRDGR